MKFCPNCGVMLNDEDRVCTRCGASQMPAQPDPFADIFVQEQNPAPVNMQDSGYMPAAEESPAYYAEQPQYPEAFANPTPVNTEAYYYNAPVYQEQPRPKKKVKWWMIAVPVVLVIAIAVALLWNPLMLRFAPETVLAKALTKTYAAFTERNAGSPLMALGNAVDENGVTVVLDVTGSDPAIEDIEFDMEYRFNAESMRYQIDMNLANAGEYLDASLYMDPQRLTIGSDRLLKGNHFGITFETFSDDIRSNALFANMDEEQLTALEDVVRMLQDTTMSMEQAAFSEEYAVVLTEFAAGLEAVLDSEKRTVGGKERKTDTVIYTVTFDELADLMEQLLEIMENDEGMKARMTYGFAAMEGGEELWEEMIAEYDYMIDAFRDTDGQFTVTFYLYRYDLVCVAMEMSGEYEGESIGLLLDVELGMDASADDILYTVWVMDGDEEGVIEITQSTQQSEDNFEETFDIQVTSPYGETVNAEMSCRWDRSSGDLSFVLRDHEVDMEFSLVLKADDEGFTLSVDDLFDMLANSGLDDVDYYGEAALSFSLEVTKGAVIATPEYKNIDEWTQGDILDLVLEMQNFGG